MGLRLSLLKVLYWFFLSVLFACASPLSVSAQLNEFKVPKSLREQVDFWILVFTKYGENQVLFHHRDDAGVIYSVVDFSAPSKNLSSREFEKEKFRAVEAEIERIRATLQLLSEGKEADTAFERRLYRLFTRFGDGNHIVRFRDAMEPGKIRTQIGIRERYREGLRRSGQYLPAMEAVFRERGLPYELTRLPFVESSFNYDAYSSVGAAGVWQFMRGTAKKYMKVGAALDERRDPIISTRAAAGYLQHAFDVLGAWPLAITSYNHGIAGVLRGVKAVGSRDISALIRKYSAPSWGFASKNFYTEFLAAVEVERNWKEYFPELEIDSPVYFDEIRLGKSSKFGQLVSLSDLSHDEFYHLNPAFRPRYFALNSAVPAGAVIKVPHGKASAVLRSIPGSKLQWRFPAEDLKEAHLGRPKAAPKSVSFSSKAYTSKNTPKKSIAKPSPKKTAKGNAKKNPATVKSKQTKTPVKIAKPKSAPALKAKPKKGAASSKR